MIYVDSYEKGFTFLPLDLLIQLGRAIHTKSSNSAIELLWMMQHNYYLLVMTHIHLGQYVSFDLLFVENADPCQEIVDKMGLWWRLFHMHTCAHGFDVPDQQPLAMESLKKVPDYCDHNMDYQWTKMDMGRSDHELIISLTKGNR